MNYLKISVIITLLFTVASNQVHAQANQEEIQRHIAVRMRLLKSIQGDFQAESSQIFKDAKGGIGNTFEDAARSKITPLNLKGALILLQMAIAVDLEDAIKKQMDAWSQLQSVRKALEESNPTPIQEELLQAEKEAARAHRQAMHEVKLQRRRILAGQILLLQRGYGIPEGKPEDLKMPPAGENGAIHGEWTDKDLLIVPLGLRHAKPDSIAL